MDYIDKNWNYEGKGGWKKIARIIIAVILAAITIFVLIDGSVHAETPATTGNILEDILKWVHEDDHDDWHCGTKWYSTHAERDAYTHSYHTGQCTMCAHKCTHDSGKNMKLVKYTISAYDGSITEDYLCDICDVKIKVVTKYTDYNEKQHEAKSKITFNEYYDYRTDYKTIYKDHDFVDGTCTTCGHECEHFWIYHNIENGVQYDCVICNKIMIINKPTMVTALPEMEILDEDCEHDWQINSYSEGPDQYGMTTYTIYYECSKCGSTKPFKLFGAISADDYCVEETEPQPRFAINHNPATTGEFMADEFCHIEAWSAQRVDTTTVFKSAKFYEIDKWGNVTYELIADNGGIAMAHLDKITVIEGELPEITEYNTEEEEVVEPDIVGCWIHVVPTDHGHDDWCQKYDDGTYKMHNYMLGQCLWCYHRCSHNNNTTWKLHSRTVDNTGLVEVNLYVCSICEYEKTIKTVTESIDENEHKITTYTNYQLYDKTLKSSKTYSHNFENGICTVCNYECEHEVWISHNVEGGIISECTHCGKSIFIQVLGE